MSDGPQISAITCKVARISNKTEWTFVEIACSDGSRGVGEASINGMSAALKVHAAMLGDKLRGRPATPNANARILQDRHGGIVQGAISSAVEQALWDAQGQRLGVSVCDLLGGAVRTSVPLYANINRGTRRRNPEGFADSARRAIDAGFCFIKLAPFDGVGENGWTADLPHFLAGLECIRATCEAAGDSAQVLVDCHWRLDDASAAKLLTFAAEHRLYWIECPIPEGPANMPRLRRLKQRATDLGVRLAGMEKGICPADFQPYIREQIYDVLMPDVKYDGGLAATRQIAEAALSSDLLIAPHNPTGPICHAASVAVSATLANLLFLEVQFGESELFQDLVGGALPFVDGTAPVLPGSGLGVSLSADVMETIEAK